MKKTLPGLALLSAFATSTVSESTVQIMAGQQETEQLLTSVDTG